jgi:nitrile hydratase accessory protein
MKSRAPIEIVTEVEETTFAEPWEARAFAIALMLSGGKRFSWDEFRDRLIAEIAQADAAREGRAGSDTNEPYYECWLAALEQVLYAKSLLGAEEIDRRAAAIASSPPAPTKAQSRGPIKIA